MQLRWLMLIVLVLGSFTPAQAEKTEKLTLISRSNILSLLPVGLQTPNLRVLDVEVAGDDLYFLVGDGSGRPKSLNAILRLRSDGTTSFTPIPEGPARGVSVDVALNVYALLLPQSRGSEPAMVRCDPSLRNCTTTIFEGASRKVWARRLIAGHVAELSLDGALYLDGTEVLAPASEPSRLLATPDRSRVMRLGQTSGTLTVIQPSKPAERLVSTIRGAEFEATAGANRAAWEKFPPNPNSRGMTIYAAAPANNDRLFLALSPYNRFAGAMIIQVAPDGATQRTIRCTLPKDDAGKDVITPAHIGVTGNRLFLVSWAGDLLTYGL